jgi:tetrahydromethanopterin S-methyltransferase subunit F
LLQKVEPGSGRLNEETVMAPERILGLAVGLVVFLILVWLLLKLAGVAL